MFKQLSLLTLITLVLCISGSLQADPVNGYAGSNEGEYHRKVVTLLDFLGTTSDPENLPGGLAVQKAIDEDPNGIGFSQLDSGMLYDEDNPNNDVTLLGTLPGEECVFAIVSGKSEITSEDHIEVKGVNISVGNRGSGAESSLVYFGRLDEEYQLPKISYEDPDVVLSQLSSNIGDVDVFLFVADPKYNNLYFDLVRNSNESLRFVPLDDSGMNNELADGSQLYEFKKILVDDSGWDTKVIAPCMKTGVYVNKAFTKKKEVARLLTRHRSNFE